MKSSLRALALVLIVSLTLACAAVTNPTVLLGGRTTPTPTIEISRAETQVETTGLPELATEMAGTLEPEAQATPEGGESSISALSTSIAATMEAAAGGIIPGTPVAGQGEGTPAAPSSADAGIRVTDSLNILLGQQSGAETLPSYHLEAKSLSPVMSSGKVAQSEETISADVQGANIHFTHTTTPPGGQPTSTEAYIIGEKNYVVKDGKVSSDLGLTAVTWSTWPINAELVLGLGSLKTTPAGNETLEGRPAEVYTLGGSTANDPTGMLAAVGMPVTDLKGQVWVDQATGALLKAVLDYTGQVTDSSGNKTTGPGHLEITVTQVGQVTVKDPGQ